MLLSDICTFFQDENSNKLCNNALEGVLKRGLITTINYVVNLMVTSSEL